MTNLLLLPKQEQPEVLAKWVVQRVSAPGEFQRWNREVSENHYLKNANLVGEQLRYVVVWGWKPSRTSPTRSLPCAPGWSGWIWMGDSSKWTRFIPGTRRSKNSFTKKGPTTSSQRN